MKSNNFFYNSFPIGQQIGTLINNDFTSSNFSISGSVVPTYNSNSITLSGGTAGARDFIQYNPYVTARNQMSITIRFTVDVFTPTSYGCGVKWQSQNTSGTGTFFNNTSFLVTSNNSEKGKIYFYGSNANGQNGHDADLFASSTTGIAVNLNDTLELIVTHNNLVFTLTAYNLTTDPTRSSPVTLTYTYSLVYPFSFVYHNTCKLGLAAFGGTQTINYWNVSTAEYSHADLLLIGDSKTNGYAATAIADRFANLWQSNNPTKKINVCSGASDKTSEVIQYLTDLSQYKAKKAIMFIGRNDLANGISTSVWQTNYLNIYNTLINAGTTVYHQLPTPEITLSQSALTNFITGGTFPASTIIQAPSTWNASTDNVADGIHPNTTGHSKIFTTQSSVITL